MSLALSASQACPILCLGAAVSERFIRIYIDFYVLISFAQLLQAGIQIVDLLIDLIELVRQLRELGKVYDFYAYVCAVNSQGSVALLQPVYLRCLARFIARS